MADVARSIPRMSAEEYLERERDGTYRHEFVDGIVYGMAGASRRHNTIALEIVGLLSASMKSQCQPFSLDVKVHNQGKGEEQFYYPDVVVTCSDLDSDDYLVRLPSLIVEVLSKSTEEADRGYKFDDYRKIHSLQEYLLVHQENACAELFRRRTNWEKETYEADAQIALESVDVTVPIAAFYRRVTF